MTVLRVGQSETLNVARLPTGTSTLTLKKLLTIKIHRKSAGEYSAKTKPEFGTGHIWVNADSKVGILRQVAEQLIWLKEQYGEEDDDKMTKDAQSLKRLVNQYV